MNLQNQSWPRELVISTAKAGFEWNRTNHIEKSTKENQNKVNLALL